MRYKWIELYNYAGLYNGMGISQIKIDFTRCVTNKIIIRGNNGSGKSTLMGAINPNPDSNDKFIPNAEARKNICISDNGIDYIIRYIHPVTNSGRGTTKGYISKCINGDMVELNPNGNVSSCKDILYNEFNLDSNYLSLASLSSENRGLVDSRPAERKKLINSIMHTLDAYNAIHKNLSKKAAVYKESINSLTYKINDLGNEVQLQASSQNIQNRISKLETERNDTIEAIAAVKIRIGEYMQILKDNNYDDVVKELKSVNIDLSRIQSNITRQSSILGIADLSTLDKFLTHLDKNIVTCQTELAAKQASIPVLLNQREAEAASLTEKQHRLDGMQSEFNYNDIKNALIATATAIDNYENIFEQMRLKNINLITKDEFDAAMQALQYLRESALALTSSYQVNMIQYVIDNQSEVQSKILSVPSLRAQLDSLNKAKSEISKEYAMMSAKRDIVDILKYRPAECKIDECPYIKEAVTANNEYPEQKFNECYNRLQEVESQIDEISKNIDEYTLMQEIFRYVSNIQRELSSNMKFIRKLPVREDFEQTFLSRAVNMDKFEDIERLSAFIDCGNMIEEYKAAKEQHTKYQAEYDLYKSKNSLIEQMLDDIQALNEKLDTISHNIEIANKEANSIQEQLTSLIDAKSKVTALMELIASSDEPKTRQSELQKIKDSLDSNTIEIEKLQEQLAELNKNLGNTTNDIKRLSDEKERVNHALILLHDYQIELKQYQDKYVKIDKIRYYSSSSTGIQTIYMQLYMNKIISTANELLSLLFDGEFVLQPFVINEGEFRIPCLGNGLLHDDISSMSTAQKSMISLILSFSILHQSATKYNVLFLDELDGGLDTSNRSYFITLLDKLMSMLRCEQCFIISHNNELNTELADLIILKSNSNEQYGGNVIWKF